MPWSYLFFFFLVLSQLFHYLPPPHQEVFSFSWFSANRVVSSAYLKLLMFLPPVLIPTCDSFSPEFLKMCSMYRLNKQGDMPQCHNQRGEKKKILHVILRLHAAKSIKKKKERKNSGAQVTWVEMPSGLTVNYKVNLMIHIYFITWARSKI